MTSSDMCTIYNLLRDHKIVSFPVTKEAEEKVEALASNISSAYFSHDIYATAEEKAVAYMYFIIKDHPFTDGNKRTAVLTFEILCELNDLEPHYDKYTLDTVAVFLEQTTTQDHKSLIQAIAKLLFN